MERKNHRGIGWVSAVGVGCALIALCSVCLGQDAMPPETVPNPGPNMGARMHRHFRQPDAAPVTPTASSSAAPPSAASASLIPASAPAPTRAPSLLDKPAEPAKVDLAAGHLSIAAHNSSLTEILHQVASASGMTIEGLGTDKRVFGSYGPGDPQEVLSSLLHGSGYNVVMLGRTDSGAPKDLTLSPRGAAVASSGPNRSTPSAQEEDAEDEVQVQPQEPASPPTPAAPNPGQPNGVRTPQQMLQEMQQLRQQQLQQQQPQPQQQP
jgi:hypothetical protein